MKEEDEEEEQKEKEEDEGETGQFGRFILKVKDSREKDGFTVTDMEVQVQHTDTRPQREQQDAL